MGNDNNLMPSFLDRQISTADRDAFGHRHYAHALRSLIELSDHTPPFSIGLLGGWGTGKSTIKELYLSYLRDDAQKNNDGRTRPEKIQCITFNAWRFGGREQDIKRALLRHVFLELGGDEENLQDRLFRQISESHEESSGFWRRMGDIFLGWVLPLPVFILSLLLLLGLLCLAHYLIPVENAQAKSIIILALSWSYAYLFKLIKTPPDSKNRSVTRISLPTTTAEQYEDLLIDQIARFKSGKSKTPLGRTGKKCERLVVFVDDLDRLSAEEMVSGLDAVRTFMEIPGSRLPKGIGLVFVISCDETKVAQALAERRRQGDMPGAVFNQPDARRYLDRIFQFRLEIPPFPRQDMRRYAIERLNELPGIKEDLKSRGVSVEAIVDRMIHVQVQNPRNSIQIINAFAQAWWVARKRETEELGTERAGGLHEGAVTKHPISLGAISAIKVSFPDFFRDLQNDPSLLHRFIDVVVRGKPLKDQPVSTQQILIEKYVKKQSNDPNSLYEYELRPEHRPLRQFLASLVGLRWPDSLQSLMLLSEDPITRKFGTKATAIYESFVSGDTQGVLEGFGRHKDSELLTQEQVRFLYQIIEDLRNDSEIRRTNASRVVADIVNRVPDSMTRLLLGSLCRELNDSPELRYQLGIHKIKKILSAAHPDDQRAVASRLIDDILTIDGDMSFRLETMESPNLEEAVDFAKRTVSLVLPIRRDHGLDPASDNQLINWLVDRIVVSGGKKHQLPFEDLEQWMEGHQSHLLSKLSDRYTDRLANELEADTTPSFDTLSAISRARRVFENCYVSGEETRSSLWKDLNRYVSLQLPEASKLAWELIVEHVTAPSASQISNFIAAFSDRLIMENNESIGIEIKTASQALLTIIRARLNDIDEKAFEKLSDLTILYSENADTGSLSRSILSELQQGNENSAKKVFDHFSHTIMSDLPVICVEYIASEFPTLHDSTKTSIVSQLNQIISSDNINEMVQERYQSFTKHVPDVAWDSAPLLNHLDSLLPQLAARHNNPNGYLTKIFPSVAPILDHASPPILGESLQNLFSNAKEQKHYGMLLSCMADYWPTPSKDIPHYNPTQIFNMAKQFAVTHPQWSSSGVLLSLRNMILKKITSPDQRKALIEATCATWAVKPNDAIDTIKNGFNEFTPDQTASLIDNLTLSDNKHVSLLSQVWSYVAQSQSLNNQVQVTNLILEKNIAGPEDEPDIGLRLWLDALSENRSQVLKNVITHDELNDLHRKRLWQQIAVISDSSIDASFLIDIIPTIITLNSVEDTANTIFDGFDYVNNLLESYDDRAKLSRMLMAAFPKVATMTIKAHIAKWCMKLNGRASLESLNGVVLTSDDISILKTHFGGAPEIKKFEKQINNK